MIYAYQLIAEAPSKKLSEVINLFSKTALEICEGQQLDMEFETRDDVTVAEYIEMIRLKTAVLLACSLKLGAIIGGASEKDASHLYDFGIQIGLAFQLQDDLLDVYGNPETFGKNIGGDILCNKKTFLLTNAYKLANTNQLDELNRWMNSREFIASEKISAITQLYDKMGIRKLTEEKIQDFFAKGMEALESISTESSKKVILKEVANNLMFREV